MDKELRRAVSAIKHSGRAVDLLVEILGGARLTHEDYERIGDVAYEARIRHDLETYLWACSPHPHAAARKLHRWRSTLTGTWGAVGLSIGGPPLPDTAAVIFETTCGLSTTTSLAWLEEHRERAGTHGGNRTCPQCLNRGKTRMVRRDGSVERG